MKFLVTGSRSCTDESTVIAEMDALHKSQIITHLIVGNAKGVDEMIVAWASSRGIPISVYKPDWKQYGRGAGLVMNGTMIAESDAVIAFWDLKSKGTKHAINSAIKCGKLHKIVKIE